MSITPPQGDRASRPDLPMPVEGCPFTRLGVAVWQAVSQCPAFILLVGHDRRIWWCSRYGYGESISTAVGRLATGTMLEADHTRFLRQLAAVLSLGETSGGVVSMHVPALEAPVPFSYRLGPVRDADGTIVGAVIVAFAVSDLAVGGYDAARFLFTDRQRQVVELLLRGGPAKGAVIARHVGDVAPGGRQASTSLRQTLAKMVDRNVLVNTDAGYAISEAFAPLARILYTIGSCIVFVLA